MDKSYFGGRCRSRRGRGASGKVVVFGILKRNGRVYIVAVDNAKSDALPVIKQKIMPDSIVYIDSLSSYDKPGVSGFIHHHINHSKALANHQNHINSIENFGIRQNASCENTTESIANLSRCSWKNANFDLTSAHRPGNFKPSGIGVEFRANLRQPLLFSVSIRLEASSQYFGDRDSHPEEANFCSCLKRMYFRSSESFSDDLFESWVFNLVYVCLLTNRNTKPQFIWS